MFLKKARQLGHAQNPVLPEDTGRSKLSQKQGFDMLVSEIADLLTQNAI
jgi:hypothetical protein